MTLADHSWYIESAFGTKRPCGPRETELLVRHRQQAHASSHQSGPPQPQQLLRRPI